MQHICGRITPLALMTLLVGFTTRGAAPAIACATVAWKGAQVGVVDESALIVWNATAHQMHFIRRATFNSNTQHFGFLVPTPTRPTLSAVDDNVFTSLEDAIKPRVVERRLTGFAPGLLIGKIFAAGKQEGSIKTVTGGVRLLEMQHVAGYDAAVIAASDAGELLQWLKKHGYESRPALNGWLEPYVRNHWIITAFKISKDSQTDPMAASYAVRMSFTADKPFFPYREPAETRANDGNFVPRSLRVYLLAQGRMQATLGDTKTGNAWGATLKFAKPLNADLLAALKTHSKLDAGQLPEGGWLNAFEDLSSPRLGTDDVIFSSSIDQTPIEPQPIVHIIDERIIVPLEGVVLVTAVGIWLSSIVVAKRRKNTHN